MRARWGCEEDEKLDQTALTASRSATGSASRDFGNDQQRARKSAYMHTCCSLRLVPSSAIRWWRTHSLRGDGCVSGFRIGVGSGASGSSSWKDTSWS